MPPTLRRPLRPRPFPDNQPGQERAVSPVRERGRTATESTLKAQTARSVRDKVLDLLTDGRYHSAYELEHMDGLQVGDWVVAVRELIEYGYAFNRRSNSLSLKRRLLTERAQDLADLLAGIDARVPEDLNPIVASEVKVTTPPIRKVVVERNVPSEVDFETDAGQTFEVADVPEGDKISLSADGHSFVISGKQLLTSTQAILAKKRSGKTYLAMVMAEQLLKLKLPFVAVDPTGVWGGLRSLPDGKPSPYDVLTLGGARGQWPLSADSGEKVAELVVALWPRSVVLDLSALLPEDQHKFVYHLCAKIFFINTRPVHFFFDEADEFAPQASDSNYKYQRRCLSAIDRLVRRGGVKGLGGTLITQRPAVINKNVLSQVGRILVLNMVAPHDIAAVEEWMRTVVQRAQDREACLAALPVLPSGDVFAITNGAGTIPLCKFRTRPKETYDSSKTPTMDEVDLPVPEVSHPPADVIERAGMMLGLVGGEAEVSAEGEESSDEPPSNED